MTGGAAQNHRLRVLPLGLSLGLANLAHIAIGVTDIVMTARLGADSLAAGALAANLFFVLAVAGVSFAIGSAPLLARSAATGRHRAGGAAVSAVVLCLGLFAVPATALLYFGGDLLRAAGQDADLTRLSAPYARWLAASLPFVLIFGVQWMAASARGMGKTVLAVSLVAVGMNAFGNWVFMYGAFGIAPMGLPGAGAATLATSALKVLLLWVLSRRRTRPADGPALRFQGLRAARRVLPNVLAYGLPAGLLDSATIGFFAALAFMLGLAGPQALAVHSIGLAVAEIGIGICLGIGEAAAIVVAHHAARQSAREVRAAVRTALLYGGGSMVGFAVLLVVFGDGILTLMTGHSHGTDAMLSAAARPILFFAALVLICDSGRLTLLGVLRGLGDTILPSAVSLISLWGIALPLAWYFALSMGEGVQGVWSAMAIAMAAATAVLSLRLARNRNRAHRPKTDY